MVVVVVVVCCVYLESAIVNQCANFELFSIACCEDRNDDPKFT